MLLNEDIELIIPVYRGEETSLALWITSLRMTRGPARVFTTLVDADGVVAARHPALAAIPVGTDEFVWINAQEHRGDHPRLLAAGFAAARAARPHSAFIAVAHADVVAHADGWIDVLLERLVTPGVYTAAFTPGGRLIADNEVMSFPDDWLMMARREVFDELGFGPETLRGFSWAAWLHIALSRRGWSGSLVSAGDFPLVVHSARRSRYGRGRRHSEEAKAELMTLRREAEKLFAGSPVL